MVDANPNYIEVFNANGLRVYQDLKASKPGYPVYIEMGQYVSKGTTLKDLYNQWQAKQDKKYPKAAEAKRRKLAEIAAGLRGI